MIDCVLFDLDGMLVDSTAAIVASCNRALVTLGLAPRGEDAIRRIIGPPLLDGFTALLAEHGDDPGLASALVAAYRADYSVTCAASTPLFDGIVGLLDGLEGRVRLAVATSKPTEFSRAILEADEVADRFEAIVGPDLSAPDESKALTVGRALDLLGRPERGAIVGDRLFDVDAGRAHGLVTVGVTWGIGSRHELEEAGADRIVDSPAELFEVLLGL